MKFIPVWLLLFAISDFFGYFREVSFFAITLRISGEENVVIEVVGVDDDNTSDEAS